jgi:hypothetical protein
VKDKNGKEIPDSDFENDLDFDVEESLAKYPPEFGSTLLEDLKKIILEEKKLN